VINKAFPATHLQKKKKKKKKRNTKKKKRARIVSRLL
jgi:hypothetical protein